MRTRASTSDTPRSFLLPAFPFSPRPPPGPWETSPVHLLGGANVRDLGMRRGIAERWGAPTRARRGAFPGRNAWRGRANPIRPWTRISRLVPPRDGALGRLRGLVGESPAWERRGAAACRLPAWPQDDRTLLRLDRLEAYPVDRWIRRATSELAARRRAKDEELRRWAVRFGPGRGYLQQLLFHLRRTTGPFPSLSGKAARPREPS
jgi:hypothetical protein